MGCSSSGGGSGGGGSRSSCPPPFGGQQQQLRLQQQQQQQQQLPPPWGEPQQQQQQPLLLLLHAWRGSIILDPGNCSGVWPLTTVAAQVAKELFCQNAVSVNQQVAPRDTWANAILTVLSIAVSRQHAAYDGVTQ